MKTISEYLQETVNIKQSLVDSLNENGILSSITEPFSSLTDKIENTLSTVKEIVNISETQDVNKYDSTLASGTNTSGYGTGIVDTTAYAGQEFSFESEKKNIILSVKDSTDNWIDII